MMINENENVLKGQEIIAQGNALGLWASSEIVRAITFIKEKFKFRTKEMIAISRQMMSFNSVRKNIFALIFVLLRVFEN